MYLTNKHKKWLLILLIFIGILVAGIYHDQITRFLKYLVNENTHPFLFVIFFIILPVIGFPISVFLILLGAKFGYYTGTLLMFGCIPLHLLASFLIANSYIRPFIDYIVESKYQIPKVPEKHAVRFSIVFMAVPGLSYAMKNYLLSLSGVPFRHYFLSGFIINGVTGMPVIIAGNFLKRRPFLLISIFIGLLAVSYGSGYVIRWWRRLKTAA